MAFGGAKKGVKTEGREMCSYSDVSGAMALGKDRQGPVSTHCKDGPCTLNAKIYRHFFTTPGGMNIYHIKEKY